MNPLVRTALIIFSFILTVSAFIFLLMVLSSDVLAAMILAITRLTEQTSSRIAGLLLGAFVIIVSMTSMVYAIMSGRLRRTRVRSNDIGEIDIGVDAIESIALNSAKTAQCGIKTAKARVAPFKGDKISIQLSAVLYSDVEVPAMMAKVQDRIKKDIERYTGIAVAQVLIKVTRVEPVATRVER
ncbi:MAG: alkaline shock response membrane anchor protein AmaP [Eubacteriales bacterium]|nr:alkaline shock response membrane anchor protein AmaP [Eubacteriales bacterium]